MIRGRLLQAVGIAGYVLGSAMMIAAGDAEQNPEWMNAVPVFIVATLSHFGGRQLLAQARASGPDSPIHDDRPDVLYLRSFASDASTVRRQLMAGWSSAEEDLAEAVRSLGDMVAVGRPGEPLPMPGAARMYCGDEWQDTVVKRMRDAPLVIIRAGSSGGLLWECEQAFATVAPERLVVLILDLKAVEYHAFATTMRRSLHIHLPSIPRFSALDAVVEPRRNPSKVIPGFFVFSAGWRAEFVPLKLKTVKFGYRELVTPFRDALRRVFVANGVV